MLEEFTTIGAVLMIAGVAVLALVMKKFMS